MVSSLAMCAALVGRVLPLSVQTPAYSNYGLNLAGYIIERISGEPFSRHLQATLLEPLGMSYSSFRVSEALRAFEAKTYALASASVHGGPSRTRRLPPPGAPAGDAPPDARIGLRPHPGGPWVNRPVPFLRSARLNVPLLGLGGWARAGSLMAALALAYLVWFSFAFHLISVRIS